ncbi:Uncharacterised protein [Chlamydia trachomatis]|nr:Uncharacterised protein [Chlamydia trachomatis]
MAGNNLHRKQWLEEYTEDEGIKNANLYGYGKKMLAVLNKESDGTYTIKSGRVPLEDYKALDPNEFYGRKLSGVPKGIHRDDKE